MYTITLSDSEISERSQSLAQQANRLIELEEEEETIKAEYKRTMADIKERRIEISSKIRKLSRTVRLGVEERDGQKPLFDYEKEIELKQRVDEFVNSEDEDGFTAPICEECRRIDGGHQDTCSKSNTITYETYLQFANAKGIRNPASIARKLELTRERDEEVRTWLREESQSVSIEASQVSKKRRLTKEEKVAAAIDR